MSNGKSTRSWNLTKIFATDSHLPALSSLDSKIVAAYNRSEEKAHKFASVAAQLNHSVKVKTTFEEVLNDPEVEAVDLLLPVQHNLEYVRACIEAQKPVAFEKPIAGNLEDARKIVELTDNSKVPVMVLEQYVYHHGVAKVKELLKEIGTPVSFIYQGTGPFHPTNKYANTKWRLSPQHVGGYLSDGGVHQVAVVTECLGSKVTQVSAHTVQLRETSGDVDVLTALFKFENGVTGTFCYGSTFGACKKTNCLQIFGTNGSIIYDWSPGTQNYVSIQKGGDASSSSEPTVINIEETKYFSLDTEFANFQDAVSRNDKQVVMSSPLSLIHI